MRILLAALILLILPGLGFAGQQAETEKAFHLDLTGHWLGYLCLAIMVAAYIAAMFEETTELRKSKPMLLAATLIWFLIVLAYQRQGHGAPAVEAFRTNLQAYMELLLFIMVSMTYLNAMEDMRLFHALKTWLVGKQLSYRQLFWITGLMVFLMSCFDSLLGLPAAAGMIGCCSFFIISCKNPPRMLTPINPSMSYFLAAAC